MCYCFLSWLDFLKIPHLDQWKMEYDKIWSLHYWAIRALYGNHRNRDELNALSARAMPDDWVNYCLIKIMVNAASTGVPSGLHNPMSIHGNREIWNPNQLFFFYASICICKIGCQSIANILYTIARNIKFAWLNWNQLNPNLNEAIDLLSFQAVAARARGFLPGGAL